MTKLELWFFKKIVKNEVKPCGNHCDNIAELYRLIREAIDNEYFEDNAPTLDQFCRENFELSQKNL